MAVSPRRYTQQEIDDFIGCPKVVSEPPKREMKLDRGHFRNDMRLNWPLHDAYTVSGLIMFGMIGPVSHPGPVRHSSD